MSVGEATVVEMIQRDFGECEVVFARNRDGEVVRCEALHDLFPTRVEPADRVLGLRDVHPSDRVAAANSFSDALRTGRLESCHTRMRWSGAWVLARRTHLDLTDDPTFGAVVSGLEVLAGGTADSVEPESVPEQAPVARVEMKISRVGRVLQATGSVLDLYGRSAEELVGVDGIDLVHPDDQEALVEAWVQVTEQRMVGRSFRHRAMHADGFSTWVLTTFGTPDPDGPVVVYDTDITEQVAAEERLRASEARFRQLADESPAAVFVADPLGKVSFHNDGLTQLHGDVVTHLGSVLDDAALARYRISVASGEPFELEVGGAEATRLQVRCGVPLDDGTVFGVVEDVTAADRWRIAAHQDPLTGLLNRPGMLRDLSLRMARREPNCSLAFIDLDGFKRVNDEHGHAAGDQVLAEVARALQAATRPDDIVARHGGDEFIVVTDHLPSVLADEFSGRIQAAVASASVPGVAELSASIGVTDVVAGDTVDEVLRRADRAMYEHKKRHSGGR